MVNQNLIVLLFLLKGRYSLGNTGGEGITLGDNNTGHCFELRDLFPINFIKEVMIIKLKMQAKGKVFGKICI